MLSKKSRLNRIIHYVLLPQVLSVRTCPLKLAGFHNIIVYCTQGGPAQITKLAALPPELSDEILSHLLVLPLEFYSDTFSDKQ